MPYKDPVRQRKAWRDYARRNSVRMSRYRRTRKSQMVQELRAFAMYMGCAQCGARDPASLDFDHLDPSTKLKSISRMISDGMARTLVWEEVGKCQILCVSCHRRKTFDEDAYLALDAELEEWLAGV